MAENDMRHLEYLQAVADSDVSVLRKKEATYQGSWKRAGGRSAWFMARRNLDRLLTMMRAPAVPDIGFNIQNVDDTIKAVEGSYRSGSRSSVCFPGSPQATVAILQHLRDAYVAEDIFAKIAEDPSGADGTVLAVVRDARRYFTLVEAEMVARGVVVPEGMAKVAPISDYFGKPLLEPHVCSVCGQEVGDVMRCYHYKCRVTGVITARCEEHRATPTLAESPKDTEERRVPRFVDAVTSLPVGRPLQATPAASPENGSQHSSLVPWAVSTPWRFKHGMQPKAPRAPVFDTWWREVGRDVWALEPAVEQAEPPNELACLYHRIRTEKVTLNSGFWVLNVSQCPAGARDWFPVLRRELNQTEYEGLPTWQRVLYSWSDERTGNWTILKEHEAWTHGPDIVEAE